MTALFAAPALARDGMRDACPTDRSAPAHTPVVELETERGATYGSMQYRHAAILDRKEIALTFDDGPDAKTTKRILDILDRHCIKATFLMVGWYAQARPDLVREVAARGHTIGAHSWTHPNNLRHLNLKAAKSQIARGFEAIEAALKTAPAEDRNRLVPFFRFPGLNDSKPLLSWLAAKNIATLSCDFGVDDWRGISGPEIKRRALRNAAATNGGITILHDTKPRTADMLSSFIVEARRQGYRFVQLTAKPTSDRLAATGEIGTRESGLRAHTFQ